MRLTGRLGLAPFAPYHWLMYGESMWFDIDHAIDGLGWRPEWSVHDMFAQSYDWFVAHRDASSSSVASRHRRTARQGVLAVAKRLSRVLPEVAAPDGP
jgi:hypothetical protein